ncbi:hypothetical protein K474DRAFT_1667280 [Panus rudis PR-1116 ss-1]|nr:hypothetical protein K474DRAFT_1667280 [Panus rudis PR-1116 ss-1]
MRIAIRMSRVPDKHKECIVEERESIDADREETPDLYRNPSLGMYVFHFSSFFFPKGHC